MIPALPVLSVDVSNGATITTNGPAHIFFQGTLTSAVTVNMPTPQYGQIWILDFTGVTGGWHISFNVFLTTFSADGTGTYLAVANSYGKLSAVSLDID